MSIFYHDTGATFSPCRQYRYSLWRRWNPASADVMFIGLNPSTADENEDDPTIRRCRNYAMAWGYGGMVMCNIFGLRATDPRVMLSHAQPTGPENNFQIMSHAASAALVVCAWGAHGAHLGRGAWVRAMVESRLPHVLRLTKGGHPAHPLYLPANLTPTLWSDIAQEPKP